MSSECLKIWYDLQGNSHAKKCFCVRNPLDKLNKFEELSCQDFSQEFLEYNQNRFEN